jgi:hypothetical protein
LTTEVVDVIAVVIAVFKSLLGVIPSDYLTIFSNLCVIYASQDPLTYT